jgi:excisionase family DNA binding protein
MRKNDLLTVKELAAKLRMSQKSIQRAYRKEEIPVEWLGRMARFNFAHVRRAMEKYATAMPWTMMRHRREGRRGAGCSGHRTK